MFLNKRILLMLAMILISMTSVSALSWSNNTFNNSLSEENLTFTTNENLTRWLTVPSGVNTVTNGFLNLSGFNMSWDISITNQLQSFSVASQDTAPVGLFFKSDGLKMYVLGDFANSVLEYDLSTEWDVSTASYLHNYTITAQETVPRGLFFKSDGLKMYTIGDNAGNNVDEYDLSMAWNVSTASYLHSFSTSSEQTEPFGLFFKPDGSKMYVSGAVSKGVFEYDLSMAWNVSTASYLRNFSGRGHLGLFIRPDGLKLYHINDSGVNEHDLSMAWNISSASYLRSSSLTDPTNYELFFKPDGLKMYHVTSDDDSVYEYDLLLPTNPYLEIGTADGSYEWNVTGDFVVENNKTLNLASVINRFLNATYLVGSNYIIPFIFHSDTVGILQYSDLIFNNFGFLENSQTFNSTTFESVQETYILNMSYDSTKYGTATPTANLFYNGTSYAGTKSGTGNTITFSRTLTVDTVTSQQNKTFYWEVILTNSSGANYFNSTTQNQTINTASLSLCGGDGGSVVFLNFTFKNETDGTSMSAINDLTDFEYWISGGGVTQTYLTSNTTANPSYAFCFSPPQEDVVTDLTFKYSANGFPLRTFQYDDQTLTNSTTNQVLYLLGSSDGIYSTIQTTESLGSPIAGVTLVVERQFSGVWTTIEQGVTGTDGAATFWVNPNFDHRITATKTSYTSTQVTIRPSQSTYTIIMDTTTGNATYTSELPGIKWVVYPHPGSIQNGTHNFNATVTSSQSNLENCKFELLNATNTSQVLATSTSFTNSTYCQPSFDYVVLKDQNFFGRLSLDTTSTDGWVIVDTDWKWIAIDIDAKSWRSITSFFEELKDLSEFGEGNEREFSRYIFFFLLCTIFLAAFFYFSGFEINNPGVSVVLIWFIILIASFAGFLSFDSGSDNINSKWEQYGFLLMFSLISVGFMLNKWRKDNE